jgi:tetratricopeptide (TPR) repeat protein
VADVFLSYARPNSTVVARAAQVLCANGYSVWYDCELPAHRPYSDIIEQELARSRCVLVLWSRDAVQSQWVRSEANRARELGKLVQGRLDHVLLPMPFDQIQCADLRRWRRSAPPQGWSQVISSIEALVKSSDPAAVKPHLGSPKYRRREVLVGATAAGIVGTAGGWWLLERERRSRRIPAAAVPLLQQARIAEWQITHEGQNQAIGLYQRVVSDNPRYADGWGYLALAYAWTAHYRSSVEAASLRSRAQSAAEQALSLDDTNSIARAGRAMAQPLVGHWKPVNGALRHAVTSRPELDDLAFHLAMFLLFTGRAKEALKYMNLVLPRGPTPAVYFYQSLMLWSAGQADALDDRLAEASRLYPTHFALWFTRFYTFMLDGRPEKSLALAADTTNWPTGIDPDEVQSVARVAQALQSRAPAAVRAVVDEWMSKAHQGAGYAENAAQFMAALGHSDEAFEVLRAYFFSEGFDCGEVRFSRVQGTFTPHNDRLTHFLFFPSLGPLRSDQRFVRVMRDLQFAKYWSETRAYPDYLRTRRAN